MKKIMITGGNGFFASRFARRYAGVYEIVSYNRQALDVTNRQAVQDAVRFCAPDYILHTAAAAATDFCNQNPDIAYKINVEGALHLGEAAKVARAKLIFISTEQIFNGGSNPGPFRETDEPCPDTVYGENKTKAEILLRDVLDELWIVRFTWLFGMPEQNCGMSGNIFWDTMKAILKNEKIYASPHEFRGMTYVNEMTEQIVKVFDSPYGTYHLGAENAKSRYEIVREIFDGLGLTHRVEDLLVKDEQKYAKKNRDVRLCCEKARGYGMVFSDTSEAIRKCIADYKLRM